MGRKAKKVLRDKHWYRGCDQVPVLKIAKAPKLSITRPIPLYYTTSSWRTLRADVLKRDQRTCQYCGAPARTADHIIPRRKGGPDTPENLVACCLPCNGTAGGKTFKSFEAKKRYILRYRTGDRVVT